MKLLATVAAATFMMASAGSAATVLNGAPASNVDTFAGTTHTVSTALTGLITNVIVKVALNQSPQWGDLDMFLSHGGVTVQLLDYDTPSDCCSGGDPFDVTFDDSAASVLGVTGAVGTYKPQNGSLAAFNGLDLAGDWDLLIVEECCFENETGLASWSVEVETAPIPLPASLPLLLAGLGVVGVLGRRRRNAAAG